MCRLLQKHILATLHQMKLRLQSYVLSSKMATILSNSYDCHFKNGRTKNTDTFDDTFQSRPCKLTCGLQNINFETSNLPDFDAKWRLFLTMAAQAMAEQAISKMAYFQFFSILGIKYTTVSSLLLLPQSVRVSTYLMDYKKYPTRLAAVTLNFQLLHRLQTCNLVHKKSNLVHPRAFLTGKMYWS